MGTATTTTAAIAINGLPTRRTSHMTGARIISHVVNTNALTTRGTIVHGAI